MNMKQLILNWFQSKLNVAMSIFAGLFVLFALLSYVWAPLSSVGMLFASVAMFLFAIRKHKNYKKSKQNHNNELATGNVTKNQEKQKKIALSQQKWQVVLIYLLSLAMIIFVTKQTLSLWF